ncbi:MAG: DEAD/DEAH box helicase [Candidatus Omnitrophota bacterium]|jgi:ATP-dependent RNA helicase DeaD|nr:MAG: DEAD/DEAH box helicase [Candidatus Omnitrophota bacterium]
MSTTDYFPPNFHDLALSKAVLKALNDVGYETPTPIQAETIPYVLAGRDILGQAQTGTGKTAAFALPILSRIDLKKTEPQVLVLTPTRELAIQVAEAFKRYAAHLKDFHVMPIYGGQDYGIQLRQLKRGVHVVVGTPGRVMDHMRRKTLNLDALSCLVLDEADEMLRMGFIDDVEWILEQTPTEHQIALFSATLPETIRRIAQKYLKNPQEITIKVHTAAADTIHQRYWTVNGLHKLDALTRILEGETFDGMIVFVRTKTETVELAEKLEARGYASAPLNGDIQQKQRERTIERLKAGQLDILVATDVAARGLDVERISHVVNYDIPHDPEAYVHRIGRTGRAGRSGEAILFVAPRERRMLRTIETATRQKIEMMVLPTAEAINDKRINLFKERITDTLAMEEVGFYYQLLEQYHQEYNVPALEIAAALAKMAQGDKPFLLAGKPEPVVVEPENKIRERKPSSKREKQSFKMEKGMERFRIEVGKAHGVNPGNIVGAIANEAGLDSKYIGRIEMFDEYSTVDLPKGMPNEIFHILKKVWVSGRQLKISKVSEFGKPPHGNLKRKSNFRDKKKQPKAKLRFPTNPQTDQVATQPVHH